MKRVLIRSRQRKKLYKDLAFCLNQIADKDNPIGVFLAPISAYYASWIIRLLYLDWLVRTGAAKINE